jgi:serine protease Do
MNTSFENDLSSVAERLRRSTVAVRTSRDGVGSGVQWDPGGLIITNAHVATDRQASVETADGVRHLAHLIARDERVDLAALRIDATPSPVPIRDAATLRAGELLLAVGNPLGLAGAVTIGTVRTAPSRTNAQWIQADIRLAPGNSGGPLADAAGRVVGINAMVTADGLALAVPGTTVQRFLARATGQAFTLGIGAIPVELHANSQASLGFSIAEIIDGGAAADAGLRIGDIIVALDGQTFERIDDLASHLDKASSTQTLVIRFIRAGRLRESTLSRKTPAERAAAA